MDRRVALGALWALFAAASVGVGFGAAGLVGDPFTDPAGGSTGQVVSSPGSATGSPAPTSSATGSPSDSPRSSGPSTSNPTSSGSASGSPSSSRSAGTSTQVGGINTRGGFVSGSCRDGLVSVGASPAVGWEIDDVDSGRVEHARVRFEGSDDSDQRVEVQASCVGGVPRFVVEDRDRGGDDGDDDGGGGGGSGSSGSNGGDD